VTQNTAHLSDPQVVSVVDDLRLGVSPVGIGRGGVCLQEFTVQALDVDCPEDLDWRLEPGRTELSLNLLEELRPPLHVDDKDLLQPGGRSGGSCARQYVRFEGSAGNEKTALSGGRIGPTRGGMLTHRI
jgi:hypothetical protein